MLQKSLTVMSCHPRHHRVHPCETSPFSRILNIQKKKKSVSIHISLSSYFPLQSVASLNFFCTVTLLSMSPVSSFHSGFPSTEIIHRLHLSSFFVLFFFFPFFPLIRLVSSWSCICMMIVCTMRCT